MTTKEKVREKVQSLLEDSMKRFEKKLDKLLNSGVINFDEEEDNYGLPKDIVQALAQYLSWQYKRLNETRIDKKRIQTYYEAIKWYR